MSTGFNCGPSDTCTINEAAVAERVAGRAATGRCFTESDATAQWQISDTILQFGQAASSSSWCVFGLH